MKNNFIKCIQASLISGIFCFISCVASAQTPVDKIPYGNIGSLSLSTNTQWLDDYFGKKITDSVQIVGLGEVSHGGIEPMDFQVKMIQYLVEKKGFRNVCIEHADFQPFSAIRNYLNNNNLKDSTIEKFTIESNFTSALKKKFSNLFFWLKAYNINHPQNKVQVAGFDLDRSTHIIDFVLNNYVTPISPSDGAANAKLFENLPNELKFQKISTWLKANQKLIEKKFPPADVKWLKFHLSSFEYGIKETSMKDGDFKEINNDSSSRYRDSMMFENVRYFAKSQKTVLIAHNAHLTKSDDLRMGKRLDQYYHQRYYLVLTDFSKTANIEVEQENGSMPYVTKSFTPDETTVAFEIMQKFGIVSGIFQHTEMSKLRLLTRTNNIDAKGISFTSIARKNAFDSLVIFENITPGKDGKAQ